jgi:hypothetical protein
MTIQEFDDLVSLHFDDALPAERLEEFNRLLATRPDLAARFVGLGRIHGSLREVEAAELSASKASRRSRFLTYAPVGFAATLLLSLVVYLCLPEQDQGPTVGRADGPEVLLVVGRADRLKAGDLAIRDRLVRSGFRVTPIKDSFADLSKTAGRALVVISESTVSSEVGNRLADAPVPLLNCEPNLNASLRLTTRSARPDEVFLRGKQRSIRVVDPSHALAGGLRGTVPLYLGQEGFVAWGVPDEAVARVIARCDTPEGEPALFGYEAGKAARGADLPARRVSFCVPANTDEADRMSLEGWILFDAAIRWLALAP